MTTEPSRLPHDDADSDVEPAVPDAARMPAEPGPQTLAPSSTVADPLVRTARADGAQGVEGRTLGADPEPEPERGAAL